MKSNLNFHWFCNERNNVYINHAIDRYYLSLNNYLSYSKNNALVGSNLVFATRCFASICFALSPWLDVKSWNYQMDSWSFLGFNSTFFIRYSALKNYFALYKISNGFFSSRKKQKRHYVINKHLQSNHIYNVTMHICQLKWIWIQVRPHVKVINVTMYARSKRQFLRLIITLTYPVRGSRSSNSSCSPHPGRTRSGKPRLT